jgi:hypothetical protein
VETVSLANEGIRQKARVNVTATDRIACAAFAENGDFLAQLALDSIVLPGGTL